jgi:hypothetical protein
VALSDERPLTLFQCVLSEVQWLKEGSDTFFSWLRQMVHLSASFAYATTRPARFMWPIDTSDRFIFDGRPIIITSFKSMFSSALHTLHKEFVDLWVNRFQIPLDLLSTSLDIDDDMHNQTVNYNHMRHPPNAAIQARADRILDRISTDRVFYKNQTGHSLTPVAAGMRTVFPFCRRFVETLALCCQISGGQPPRFTELLATQFLNTATRARNIYFFSGRVFNIGMLNKTTFQLKQDKPIPRQYPHLVGLILFHYISFVRPIEILFLFELGQIEAANLSSSFLFHVCGNQLQRRAVTGRMEDLTEDHVGYRFGIADFRQVIIFFGSKMVRKHDVNDRQRLLLDLQAGHSTEVAKQWYAVEAENLPSDLSSDVIEAFARVSTDHHSVLLGSDQEVFGNPSVSVCVSLLMSSHTLHSEASQRRGTSL